MTCGVCGRPMTCGGKKDRRVLVCSGAARYNCWNSVSQNLGVASLKLVDGLLMAIAALPDFDVQLRNNVAAECELLIKNRDSRRRVIQSELADISRQIDRVTDAIAKSSGSDSLMSK